MVKPAKVKRKAILTNWHVAKRSPIWGLIQADSIHIACIKAIVGIDTVGGAMQMHMLHSVKELEAADKMSRGDSLNIALIFFGTGITTLAAAVAFNL
jgi:hypothetical protein